MKQERTLQVQSFRMVILTIAMLGWAVASTITARAQTYTALYEFGSQAGDPANPPNPGTITQGRDGALYSTARLGGSFGVGSAFKITPSGTLSVMYSFAPATQAGSYPYSGLTLGTDGNFYGSTLADGTHNLGTLFNISSSGSLTTMYEFGTCAYPCKEGVFPKAAPVQGTDGNFYGTTPNTIDGTNHGVAYKLTPAGKYTTIYVFTGTVGFNPNAPLMLGTDGNFYGTTALGGKTVQPTCFASNSTCGTVFKMTPSGKVTFLYDFDQTHGAGPIGPVIQGSDGNFYGTTSAGGTGGFGVVFKLTPKGVLTVLHNFNGTDGETPTAGLVQASDGNFYGVASAGGTLGYGTIFKVTAGGSFSVLYNFDNTTGATPEVTLFQDTNGILYGDTLVGGSHGNGVFYTMNVSAPEFARLQYLSGKVGTQVGIFGQGFTGTSAVSFNGVNATTFSVTSDTYLTANVPTGGKTGLVTVVRPTGTLTTLVQFKVTPIVSSISPTSGPVGTVVTIQGTGLTQATKVTFGGGKAASFTVNSDSQVTATVPTGAKTGKIAITTPGGTASSATFTVH